MSGTRGFDKLLEKATSPLLLEVDWESIIQMCDLIRQGDVPAKHAVAQLKKKMSSENIHVLNFALQCLESMVKNCGTKVHQEVATRDFMDSLRTVAGTKPDPVKTKVLELIQCWSHAFKKNPNYKVVEDYYTAMKLDGFQYPQLKESEAMFNVEEAPAWKEDAECSHCFRCRTEFSTLRRRHHCRNCGQIFCNACSAKSSPIPKYGIEKEVRVCDTCFDKINRGGALQSASGLNGAGSSSSPSDDLPIEYLNSPLFKETVKQQQQLQVGGSGAPSTAPKSSAQKSEQEFEEELQLALALSQSEAEAKDALKVKKSSSKSSLKSSANSSSQSKLASNSANNVQITNNWQQPNDASSLKSMASAPYADMVTSSQQQQQQQHHHHNNINTNGASQMAATASQQETAAAASAYNQEELRINAEIDAFVEEIKRTLDIYRNRMKSDSMRGRSITNDTAVQSLFLQLQHMHPKLLSYIKYQEDARAYYENLQDKLTQLKDAREALNALRHESSEKKRRDNEERERLRQLQIAQKLQHMRQQKQHYYLYQNQLNLQRMQEQERDLQMRLDQQRQLVVQRDQNLFAGSSLAGGAAIASYGQPDQMQTLATAAAGPAPPAYATLAGAGGVANAYAAYAALGSNNTGGHTMAPAASNIGFIAGEQRYGVIQQQQQPIQTSQQQQQPTQQQMLMNNMGMLESNMQALQLQQFSQIQMQQQQQQQHQQQQQQQQQIQQFQQWQQQQQQQQVAAAAVGGMNNNLQYGQQQQLIQQQMYPSQQLVSPPAQAPPIVNAVKEAQLISFD